jgi:hypothetical protein
MKQKQPPTGFSRVRLDTLPADAGYLLSVGPAILWLDRARAQEILALLANALAPTRGAGVRLPERRTVANRRRRAATGIRH